MINDTRNGFLPALGMGCLLSKVAGALMSDIDVALAGTGVTSSQVGVLLSLSKDRAHSPAALARLLGLDAGYLTRVLDRLEGQGLVCRSRDRLDRRIVNLGLTESGRRVVERIEHIAPEVLNRRLFRFTTQEFEILSRLLAKLLDN
jgi:DNA-binding MarR family transcriptional regulator